MVRLINTATGVAVNVDEELASKLGPEWSAEKPEEPKRKPGRPRKASDK